MHVQKVTKAIQPRPKTFFSPQHINLQLDTTVAEKGHSKEYVSKPSISKIDISKIDVSKVYISKIMISKIAIAIALYIIYHRIAEVQEAQCLRSVEPKKGQIMKIWRQDTAKQFDWKSRLSMGASQSEIIDST